MSNKEKTIEIENTVKNVLAESLDIDVNKIKRESLLIEDLGIDSFGFAELSYAVQEKFKFEIPVEDAQNIKTVNDLMDYVDSKITEV